jgi:hypothetical protein
MGAPVLRRFAAGPNATRENTTKVVLSASCGSHQKWWRSIRARIPRGLRGDLRSDSYPIDTESALLDINAQHFDRIVIFKGNAEVVRRADFHVLGQHGVGTVEAQRFALAGRPSEDGAENRDGRIAQVFEPATTETGSCATSTHDRFARDNQRLARRGLAIESLWDNQAADKS